MSPLSKSTVSFDESTLIADRWVLERIANAARRLLPSNSDQHIFIKLDHFMNSHFFFLVVLGSSPNKPLHVWKTTVIDEDIEPQFESLPMEE
jgi:hypothetical protein